MYTRVHTRAHLACVIAYNSFEIHTHARIASKYICTRAGSSRFYCVKCIFHVYVWTYLLYAYTPQVNTLPWTGSHRHTGTQAHTPVRAFCSPSSSSTHITHTHTHTHQWRHPVCPHPPRHIWQTHTHNHTHTHTHTREGILFALVLRRCCSSTLRVELRGSLFSHFFSIACEKKRQTKKIRSSSQTMR